MARVQKAISIPEPTNEVDSLWKTAQSLKEAVEMIQGIRGTREYALKCDLEDLGNTVITQIAGGGSGSTTLDALTDTDLTSQGQYDLLFNADGTEWQDTDGGLIWNPSGFLQLSNDFAINFLSSTAASIEMIHFDPDLAGDPDFGEVELLAQFEGADTDTSYTELSSNGFAATFVDTAQIDTAQFNFGASSIVLDGAGDIVTFPNDAALEMGSGDWTVEFFFRSVSTLSNPEQVHIISHYGTAGNRPWAFTLRADGFSNNKVSTYIEGAHESFEINNTTFAVDTWYHGCITREGSDYFVGINGFREFSNIGVLGGALETSDEVLRIGSNPNSIGDDYDGHVDDVRITIGTSRYDLSSNATYTVPTSYPAGGTPGEFTLGDPSYPTNIEGTEVLINGAPIESNATHTGEVTGATVLTVEVESITNKTDVVADSADDVAIHDDSDGSIKKVNLSSITDAGYF
jgi:hypothetical protein